MLQWGRGCEPADICISEHAQDQSAWLQWGRGCEPADITRERLDNDSDDHASMGPRV